MDPRKKIVLALFIVSAFIFLVAVLVFVYALSSAGQQVPGFLALFIEYHIHFMVIMGVFGVGSGLLVYSIMNATIEKEKMAAKTNLAIIMRFLGKDDRDFMALLTSKGGMTTQGEISRLPDMTRLRAHRAVRRLEGRGIVHVEKHGKINLVRLVDELREEGH